MDVGGPAVTTGAHFVDASVRRPRGSAAAGIDRTGADGTASDDPRLATGRLHAAASYDRLRDAVGRDHQSPCPRPEQDGTAAVCGRRAVLAQRSPLTRRSGVSL